ncbi:hypothetical protein SETIT_5G280200v2 [Setaria italica]|uniref:Uncharacterized protein n=1 Tax=Setaria italica TaxID=4555 RepID=A0A368R9R7_SETIT|nr:hypothetical protein SETIT_5G280200v2 [Setaria italica]
MDREKDSGQPSTTIDAQSDGFPAFPDGALHPGLNTDGQRIASRCMKSLSPPCSLPAAGCNFAAAQESGARQADRQVLRLPRRAR